MKRIEKTFREKVNIYFQKVVEKHSFMRIPSFLTVKAIFGIHDFWFILIGSWKKYAFTSFLLINIIIGSSFAHPVFGERDGFISGELQTETIPADESTIELMRDEQFSGEEIFTEDSGERRDLNDYESYTLSEILEERGIVEEITEPDLTQMSEGNLTFSSDDWRLILINKQHPIPDDYEYVLGTLKGNMMCDERIIDDLVLMMQKAQAEGIELVTTSLHRDQAYQEMLFNRKIDAYMRRGLSYLEAYKRSAQTVTIPGTSEHQVGLAIDITSRDYTKLNAGFADTQAGQWLNDNSYKYGFILRYPLGKEYITSIEFEPWHFRYVGKEAAKIIKEEHLTLEEFVEKYVK